MHSSNIIIHGLWIGNKLSIAELITLKSFISNGHQFWLWTYNPIETEVPPNVTLKNANEIIPSDKVFCYKYTNQFGHGKGSYAGFSDIFRYKLLHQYGGWWTDMDVTCLKPLDFKEEYVFRVHHSLPLVGNIMKCPKGSKLMEICYKEASEKVTAENRDWHLPIEILVKNVYELKLEYYIKNFSNTDSWDIIRKFLRADYKIPDNWYVIHWVNEEWRRNNIDKNEFLKNSLFFKLARQYGLNPLQAKGFNKIKKRVQLTKVNFGIKFFWSKIKTYSKNK